MTNQPIRADWWREVTDPSEVIPAGCPARFEYRGFAQEMDMLEGSVAFERVFDHVLKRNRIYENALLFIDSRWTPPRPAYKVGDLIETVEDLERLPECAGFVDDDGDLWQVDRDECGETIGAAMAGGSWEGFTEVIYFSPFTVVHLPKPEATE